MFAVELFVIFFCTLCCLFYSPESNTNEDLVLVEVDEGKKIEEKVEDAEEIYFDAPTTDSLIETLSFVEAKKVVSSLKELKITSAKLTGKGRGKEYFQEILKDLLPDHEPAVNLAISKEIPVS